MGQAKTHSGRFQVSRRKSGLYSAVRCQTARFLVLFLGALPLLAREKDAVQYGAALIVNLPFSESEVVQVVQDVAQNGIIRGTKEYNKDEYVSGAKVANSTRAFKEWTEGGKVFYKVRLKALDPRNFKDGGDTGTLAVRYVVQSQDEKHTLLRIDAVFVEDFRHASHPSNGSVEGAEYKDIHDHLDAIELLKTETADAQRQKEEKLASKQEVPKAGIEESSSVPPPAPPAQLVAASPGPTPTEAPPPPAQTPEQHLHDLRVQVERLVKEPGAPLKAAPFHTASTLQSLPTGTEVLIVISTPYWLGVETHEGQHGWVLRDELEQLP